MNGFEAIEEYMNYLKVAKKEDVEQETLKKFLANKSKIFNKTLIDLNKTEPTDIRYEGINYQITEGDKEQIQKQRQVTSKGFMYIDVRDITNIAEILLRGTLTKKSMRSDLNTILLIDVMSTGGREIHMLEKELLVWSTQNSVLCRGWKEIYIVYSKKNIKLIY